MQDQDLHLQRLLDGALSAPEAAGVTSQIASDPRLGARLSALQGLDAQLQDLAQPMTSASHQLLLSRISDALPRSAPAVHARVRPTDVIMAIAVLAFVMISFGTAGSLLHGSTVLLALACVGLVSGMLILVLAAMVRRAERGLLRHLLGTAVSLGPADLLVYRAIGIGLSLGGLYLAHLA